MLLEAAVCYDRRVSALLGEDDSLDTVNASREPSTTGGPFPNLFIIVTGLYYEILECSCKFVFLNFPSYIVSCSGIGWIIFTFAFLGKGPLRDEYERKIQKLRLKRVTFRTMWVSAKDYPLLLGKSPLMNSVVRSLVQDSELLLSQISSFIYCL